MKLKLPEALHARPANLLVRLASQHAAVIELRRCGAKADARRILEVLALGAAKGDEIEIVATGDAADAALAAIGELVERAFDADLVPETGSIAVEGIAVGRAVVVTVREADARSRGSYEEEVARLRDAELRARASLDRLIDGLDEEERALLMLKEVEGYSVEELADMMSMNENTIKVKLFRARQKLVKASQRLERPGLVNEKG